MASCPKCHLPNPDGTGVCLCEEPGPAEAVAAVVVADPGEGSVHEPAAPAACLPAVFSPQVSAPLVEPILTPSTPAPEYKPLPSHVNLLFARATESPVARAPAGSATLVDAPRQPAPGATLAAVVMTPTPSAGPTPTGAGSVATAVAPTVRPKLVVLRGMRIGVEYPIYDGRNVIGRFADRPVDIDLVSQEPEGQVWSSRHHAAVTFDKNMVVVEDLNSLNGTWLNGARLYPGQARPLKPNDVIQIGTVQMKLLLG